MGGIFSHVAITTRVNLAQYTRTCRVTIFTQGLKRLSFGGQTCYIYKNLISVPYCSDAIHNFFYMSNTLLNMMFNAAIHYVIWGWQNTWYRR